MNGVHLSVASLKTTSGTSLPSFVMYLTIVTCVVTGGTHSNDHRPVTGVSSSPTLLSSSTGSPSCTLSAKPNYRHASKSESMKATVVRRVELCKRVCERWRKKLCRKMLV